MHATVNLMTEIAAVRPSIGARIAAIVFLLVSLGLPLTGQQRPDPSDRPLPWQRPVQVPNDPPTSTSLKNSAVDLAFSWLDAGNRAQEPRKAIENYERALPTFRLLQLRSVESLTLNRLGLAYAYVSQYGKAIDCYEQALAIMRKIGDRAAEGATLNDIGETYRSLSQYAKAIDFYEQALAIEREVGDRAGEGTTLNNVGEVYRYLSRYAKAVGFYEQALVIRREVHDRVGEGATLNNLGAAHASISKYAKAIGFYERALAIEREVGNRRGEGATLNNLGGIYCFLSQYAKAIDFYEQALFLRRAVGDRAGEGATLNNLGVVHDSLSHQATAIDFYEQALAIRRKVGDRAGEGATLDNLGGSYYGRGQQTKAIGFYEQALSIRRAIGNRAGEGATLNNLGLVYDSLGHHTKAIDFYEQALAIRREVGDRAGEAVTLMNLMLTLASQQRPRLAVLFGKQAVNVYQQIRQDLAGLDNDIRKTYLQSNEYTYRRLADLLLAQDRIAEAQQVLNLLKEEEFFDFVRRDSGQASSFAGRAELTPDETKWNQHYNKIAGRLTELGRERGELIALEDRSAEQNQRLTLLDNELKIANEAFQKFLDRLEAEASQHRLTEEKIVQVRDSEALKGTLRELGSGTVAIYTLVTEDKLWLILITPYGLRPAEAAITRTDLNTKIVAFRQSLENRRSDPRPLARELYQLILGPVEKDLAGAKAETILWSLDGAMRYLPVAALYDGEHYLIERFRNVVFTPASNANLKDVPAVQWRALGLGVSKAHKGFAALPGAQKELESIIHDEATNTHGVLPGAIQLDDAFTRQSMLSALHQRYRVVHIASHFRFKPGNETDSYLLLGDGGHMSLADVGTMENPFDGVDLLTLSACDTASGGTGANGKEVEGFAVLAQRKGAKAVIATLWPVADASTNELMQSFYRIRDSNKGMPKVEALQQAQLALLHGSTYSHPYYWAPFILIGNSR
jgi:CHAT domain-containing protein/Tfp pilus assembly protein PilF